MVNGDTENRAFKSPKTEEDPEYSSDGNFCHKLLNSVYTVKNLL